MSRSEMDLRIIKIINNDRNSIADSATRDLETAFVEAELTQDKSRVPGAERKAMKAHRRAAKSELLAVDQTGSQKL